jgi:hypothetical protein
MMQLSKLHIPKWAWALFTIATSIAGATWTARGLVDVNDKRISVLERVILDMHDDVREIRRVLLSHE